MHSQLTQSDNFNPENILFSKAKEGANGARINVGMRYPDGSTGDLILPINWPAFCFGVQANREGGAKKGVRNTTGKIQGYSVGIALYDKDGATREQADFVDMYDKICEEAIEHMLSDEVAEQLKKHDITRASIGPIGKCMYWHYIKNDKRELIREPGTGPTLYAKLITNRDLTKCYSLFSDENGNPLDFNDLVDKRCYMKASIKIESIFVGAQTRLQVKLNDAEIIPISRSVNRFVTKEAPVVALTFDSSFDTPRVREEPAKVADDSESSEEETSSVVAEKPLTSAEILKSTEVKTGRRLLKKITK